MEAISPSTSKLLQFRAELPLVVNFSESLVVCKFCNGEFEELEHEQEEEDVKECSDDTEAK